MPVLMTSRLNCSPLQEQDWPFFLALQQHPKVMCFVAENRPVAAIREAFDSRLTPWTPGSAHWLCASSYAMPFSTGPAGRYRVYSSGRRLRRSGLSFCPQAQGKGYGFESLQALCDYAFHQGGIRRLTATVTAGNVASRPAVEVAASSWKASYVKAITFLVAGNDWLFGLLLGILRR